MTLDPSTPPLNIWQLVANASDVIDGGKGVRFEARTVGSKHALPAFVIRHDGITYAYLNQCAHVAMEMDWQEGQFFDLDQRYLMCATHGAMYEPDTGVCVAGPCIGKQLQAIKIKEENGNIYAQK